MKSTKSQFIAEFEPIRGFAALTVALMHSFFVLDPLGSTAMSGAKVVFNGFAAVTLFFVLSGVVLGLALDRYSGSFAARWRQFLILRVFRIYPMIVVVTAAICLYLLVHGPAPHPGATEWFNRYYQEPLSWYRALQNFLLINVSLNPVGWTLMVEMGIAVIFPLLHRVARRGGLLTNLGMLLALIVLAFLADELRALAPGNRLYVQFCELILPHAYKFYLGLLLPGLATQRVLDRIGSHATSYFAAVVVVLIGARTAVPMLGGSATLAIVFETLAAGTLLLPFCTWNSRGFGARLFHSSAIRWLGRISYSFYLWHFIVLYVTATVLFEYWPGPVPGTHPVALSALLASVSIAIAGVASELSYRYIELRYMDMGRKLSRALAAQAISSSFDQRGKSESR
ncbi:acyltransferase family protein [Steroidobacter flavus]|uniref:Acyltransferase family protein n=1 Tax=Steroidobacter flavus TaxID=1842136 RepID=A0ABV8T0I8_9GAMM